MPPGDALFHKHEFKSLDAGAVSCKMTAYTKGKQKNEIDYFSIYYDLGLLAY